jgi:hypothetical protein
MSPSWWHLVSAAVSGGTVVKLLDYVFAEYRRRREASANASQIVNRHLDPILKAADELVGRLRSLAQRDFLDFASIPDHSDGLQANIELTNFLYLFGQFWARVQIFRREALFVNVSANRLGGRLKAFLETLEIRRVRAVDRPRQRGMGEALIQLQGGALSCLTYYEFVDRFLSDQQFRDWFRPLSEYALRTAHTRERQQILIYGAVLHAMIDTIDPKHLLTRDRPGWPNKLTKKSRRELRFRTFKIYLPFVREVGKYAGN